MKTILKILKWLGLVILLLAVILFISGAVLYNKKYDAPMPDLHASTESAVIEHGKHLVIATAHCVECHYKPGDSLKAINGEDVELAGGAFPFEFPGGIFYSRLIPESIMPWGQFKYLNETELLAIWKYLHTLKAVEKDNGATIQKAT